MKIHSVSLGEGIRTIAEQYGVPESRILFDNGLDAKQKLYPGQTLIIGEPIRTDSVRGGDTPERIAARNTGAAAGRDVQAIRCTTISIYFGFRGVRGHIFRHGQARRKS